MGDRAEKPETQVKPAAVREIYPDLYVQSSAPLAIDLGFTWRFVSKVVVRVFLL